MIICVTRELLDDLTRRVADRLLILNEDPMLDCYLVETDTVTGGEIMDLLKYLKDITGGTGKLPVQVDMSKYNQDLNAALGNLAYQQAMQQAQMQQAQPPAGFYGWGVQQGMAPAPAAHNPNPIPIRKTAEPIVAQRSWALTEDYKLRSTYTSTVWEGPILRADVRPKARVRVGDSTDNGHGIYAWHIGVPTLVHNTCYVQKVPGAVNGTVELKGRVIRHENGYRAEVVRIRNLCVVELDGRLDRNDVIAALEERYQCDVTWFFTLGDIYSRILQGV